MATKARPKPKKAARRKARSGPRYAKATSMRLIDERFRLYAVRGDKGRMALDDALESLSWVDDKALMTGDVTLRLEPQRANSLSEGDQLVLESDRGTAAKFTVVDGWPMRLVEPSRDPVAGTLTASLANEIATLQASQDHWSFKHTKARPHGWQAHTATTQVLKRAGLKAGALAKGKARFRMAKSAATPYEMIVAFYRRERERTGRRYVIELRGGRVTVRTPTYSARLRDYSALITAATINRRRRGSFATDITVHGTKPKGKHRKAVTARVTSPAAKRRFGWVHDVVTLDDAHTEGGARKLGKRRLAQGLRPIRELSFTAPGSTLLRRGDSIAVSIPGENFNGVLWVSKKTHTLTPGSHDMEVTVRLDDPIAAGAKLASQAAAKDRKAHRPKAKKAAQRKGKK